MNASVQAQIEAATASGPKPLPSNWRNDGREFERELEVTAGGYQSRRIATFKKVDPPIRVFWRWDATKQQKVQQTVFLRNPHLDYCGAWTARHGRALFVEAKSTSKPRLPFAASDAGLKPEQWASMKTWRLAGAACCLLWRFDRRVALWTPDMLLGAEARGQKSITFDSGIAVPAGEGSVLWDFLPVLERACWPSG